MGRGSRRTDSAPGGCRCGRTGLADCGTLTVALAGHVDNRRAIAARLGAVPILCRRPRSAVEAGQPSPRLEAAAGFQVVGEGDFAELRGVVVVGVLGGGWGGGEGKGRGGEKKLH